MYHYNLKGTFYCMGLTKRTDLGYQPNLEFEQWRTERSLLFQVLLMHWEKFTLATGQQVDENI